MSIKAYLQKTVMRRGTQELNWSNRSISVWRQWKVTRTGTYYWRDKLV